MFWRLMILTGFCLFPFCGLCHADDCGLRGFDGSQIVHFECEEGTPTSRFRVTTPSGETRGVVLVDIDQPGASRFRVRYNKADGTPVIKALGHISPGIAIDSCEELQMIGYLKAYPLDANYHLSKDIDCAATLSSNPAHSKSLWGKGYSARFPNGWDGRANSGDESVPELELNQLGDKGFNPLGTFNVTYKDKKTGRNVSKVFPFTGTFDGKGYAINDLHMWRVEKGFVGLFAKAERAILRNVRLLRTAPLFPYTPVYIGGSPYGGALVADCIDSHIENCHATVKVRECEWAGALVGKAERSKITSCSSDSVVEGDYSVGGIVGYLDDSRLEYCRATARVFSDLGHAGGLVGKATNKSSLFRCALDEGKISTSGGVAGGLVGNLESDRRITDTGSKVEECYVGNTVEVIAEGRYYLYRDKNDNVRVGPYHDIGLASGLIGNVSGNCVIKNCYSVAGTVNASRIDRHAEGASGLVGSIYGEGGIIQNCYTTSPVYSRGRTAEKTGDCPYFSRSQGRGGGLICDVANKWVNAGISNCFATGRVENIKDNKQQVGGFIGYHARGSLTDYSNNFWYNNTNIHGVGLWEAKSTPDDVNGITKANGIGDFYGTGSGSGGKVYSTWDFTNVWKSRPGKYPCLRWDKNCR